MLTPTLQLFSSVFTIFIKHVALGLVAPSRSHEKLIPRYAKRKESKVDGGLQSLALV